MQNLGRSKHRGTEKGQSPDVAQQSPTKKQAFGKATVDPAVKRHLLDPEVKKRVDAILDGMGSVASSAPFPWTISLSDAKSRNAVLKVDAAKVRFGKVAARRYKVHSGKLIRLALAKELIGVGLKEAKKAEKKSDDLDKEKSLKASHAKRRQGTKRDSS